MGRYLETQQEVCSGLDKWVAYYKKDNGTAYIVPDASKDLAEARLRLWVRDGSLKADHLEEAKRLIQNG